MMMRVRLTVGVLALPVFLCAAQADAQQCALDPNGNGVTAINELILAVNQALSGCPGSQQPTPTRTPGEPSDACPYDFNDDNGNAGDPFCAYEGRVVAPCEDLDNSAVAGWWSDGRTVYAILNDGSSSLIIADRTSATTARIHTVATGEDFENEYSFSGTFSLPSRARFRSAVDLGQCDLTFTGDFERTITALRQRRQTARGALGHPEASQDLDELIDRARQRLSGRAD